MTKLIEMNKDHPVRALFLYIGLQAVSLIAAIMIKENLKRAKAQKMMEVKE